MNTTDLLDIVSKLITFHHIGMAYDVNGKQLIQVVVFDICGEQGRKYLAVGENGKILSTEVQSVYDTIIAGHKIWYKFKDSFDKLIYVV